MKEAVPVRGHVERIGGLSGHADWSEVLRWLEPLEATPPRRVFTTHGEPESAGAMAGHIRERFRLRPGAPPHAPRPPPARRAGVGRGDGRAHPRAFRLARGRAAVRRTRRA